MAFISFLTMSIFVLLLLGCTAAPMKPVAPANAAPTATVKKLAKPVSRNTGVITIDVTSPKENDNEVDMHCLLHTTQVNPLCHPLCCFREFSAQAFCFVCKSTN